MNSRPGWPTLPGVRLAQDNAIWKPPSGKALLCHQDAAYVGHLDPPNMTTCWMALDDTAADTGTIYYVRGSHRWPHAPMGGTFHAPDDSHMISTDTRWNPDHPHPIYSRYRRPYETELDEAFFPILWQDGYRTPWLEEYGPAPADARSVPAA